MQNKAHNNCKIYVLLNLLGIFIKTDLMRNHKEGFNKSRNLGLVLLLTFRVKVSVRFRLEFFILIFDGSL